MRCSVLAGGLVVMLLATSAIRADTVTMASSNFSLSYGASQVGVQGGTTWTTAETASINTPTIQGDFTFAPAPTGASFGSPGATFPGGVLTNGGSSLKFAGIPGTWQGSTFSVPITASYNGSIPGASNATLAIEITNLSIYGADCSETWAVGGGDMSWAETTPGHAQTSPSVALQSVSYNPGCTLAASYTLVPWNPADYAVSLSGLNDAVTRTFNIVTPGGEDDRFLEGLVIQGRVNLTYDAAPTPEPSTIVLLMTGLIGLLCYAWRKQK